MPMVAGLSVVHGLVPPHPAAMLAVTAYNADIGRTVLLAILVGIPTVILGPGEMALCHQTDEHCRVERIEQAAEVYGRIARAWCGRNDS